MAKMIYQILMILMVLALTTFVLFRTEQFVRAKGWQYYVEDMERCKPQLGLTLKEGIDPYCNTPNMRLKLGLDK